MMFRVAMLRLLLIALTTLVSAQYRRSTCSRAFKTPIPVGTRCGQYGTITSQGLIAQTTMLLEPVNNCRDQCMDDGNCQAFSYNANTKVCKIYNKGLTAMGFKTGPASGGVRLWERNCASIDCDTLVTTTLTQGSGAFDTNVFAIDLPFPISMYGKTVTRVYMSVNGVLSFSQPASTLETNQRLQSTTLPDVAVCAYWNDLIIQAQANQVDILDYQEMTWEYRNGPGNRVVKFFWKTKPYSNQASKVEVELWFYEGDTGPAFLFYGTNPPDRGVAATVGSQCYSCGKHDEYFGVIKSGLTLAVSPEGKWYDPLNP